MAAFRRPIICLVTDRRRLPEPGEPSVIRLAAAAANAGVTLIHVRERDLHDRRLVVLTREILSAVAHTQTRVVVNDRVDVALAAGADGVHLREDSMSADRVRGMVPDGFLIGRSVHSPESAARAASTGVDYLVMGTIHPTTSKPDRGAIAGLPGLSEACRATSRPVLAIGGVTADNVRDLAAVGAAGIAAIRLFADVLTDDGHGEIDTAMSGLVARIRRAFDTAVRVP